MWAVHDRHGRVTWPNCCIMHMSLHDRKTSNTRFDNNSRRKSNVGYELEIGCIGSITKLSGFGDEVQK